MSAPKDTSRDHKSLKSFANRVSTGSQASLNPPRNRDELSGLDKTLTSNGFVDDKKSLELVKVNEISTELNSSEDGNSVKKPSVEIESVENRLSEFSTKTKAEKVVEKDKVLLSRDNWLTRNGHTFSYIGIFLFTFTLYFRPYELIPGLGGLSSMALYVAVATIVIFIPTQFMMEGNLTTRPPEINYILIITALALVTIPIARSPSLSWETFYDTFLRVVLMFIVMVNVIKTEARLRGLMLLSVGIGVYLGFVAFGLYREGKTTVEDYRVGVDFGGMFGNPNELATHFVMFLPIAIALAFSTKKLVWKIVYLISAFFMAAGILVTFSRGAFLGLIISGFVFAWKIGRNHKVRVVVISLVSTATLLAVAPNGYGLRVLSIFLPGLDAVGSSDQRKDLLIQSLFVTLRNPWGTGMKGFTIGSTHNLETHNGFTQVSTDIGILGLIVYILLLTSPIRRLGAIERQLFAAGNFNWIYYLSIGVQVSIIAFMVASFFGSFAFNWFVYFPIAYAVALRRIYAGETEVQNKIVEDLRGSFVA
jgi:hypothetical protein